MADKKNEPKAEEQPAEQWLVTSYVEWKTGENEGRWANRGVRLSDLAEAELKSLRSNKAVVKFKPDNAEHREIAGLPPLPEGGEG